MKFWNWVMVSFFSFTPKIGEDEPILTSVAAYFSNGLVQPPTRKFLGLMTWIAPPNGPFTQVWSLLSWHWFDVVLSKCSGCRHWGIVGVKLSCWDAIGCFIMFYKCAHVSWFGELLINCGCQFVCFPLAFVASGCLLLLLLLLLFIVSFSSPTDTWHRLFARRCPKRENNLHRRLWKPEETRRSVIRWGISRWDSRRDVGRSLVMNLVPRRK